VFVLSALILPPFGLLHEVIERSIPVHSSDSFLFVFALAATASGGGIMARA